MLLAALRSERNRASGGGLGRAPSSASHGAARTPALPPPGRDLPLSLTGAPKACVQPVPPRPHAPRVQAVLLAQLLGEEQLGEEVRQVVAGEGQVDLGAGLGATTCSGQGADTLPTPRPQQSHGPARDLVVPGPGVRA